MSTLRRSSQAHHHALVAALRDDLAPALALLGHDAEALLARAEVEGVRPLLVDRLLRRAPRALPDRLRARLLDRAARETALAVHAHAELGRCLTALATAGVACLVFKGGATARTVFPRPELRPMDDVDLLLAPAHRETAIAVLTARGYRRVPGHDALLHQCLLRRPAAAGGQFNIDLHWRLSSVAVTADIDDLSPRSLLLRARALPALGPAAHQPDPLDALLIASQHLYTHHAGELRLVWLYEIHHMLAALTADERQSLKLRARDSAREHMLASALVTTHLAFDSPVRDLLEATGRDLTTRRSRTARWFDELRDLPGARARLAWLAQHALPPPQLLRARYPGRALPLAYLLRALNAAGTALRR